jgi:Rrf2 family protein
MMMALAKLSGDGDTVGLADVAKHCSVSRRYLEQLITPLRNAALVRATSGRGGGYTLSRPPEQIKVGEIIEAAIGPIAITDCVLDAAPCMHHEFCSCRALWTLINRKITNVLHEYSLADILDNSWQSVIQKELEELS